MGQFQRMSGVAMAAPISGIEGGSLPLKYIPAVGEKLPSTVQAAPAAQAIVNAVVPRPGQNFLTFTLRFIKAGDAQLWAGSAPITKQSDAVAIKVLAAVAWPPAGTQADALQRLFLAETPAPGNVGYTDANAEKAMTWMLIVLRNRLAKASAQVGSEGAKTIIDVLRAKNQFEGFSSYPILSAKVAGLLSAKLAIANDPSDTRSDAMRRFFAIAARVSALTQASDPCQTGLYFWRTQGSGAPSADSTAFATLLGNTFYTLK